MRVTILALIVFIISGAQIVPGQERKPLSHDVYSGWNTISGVEISPDGNWVVYQSYPQEGDGSLIIYNLEKRNQYEIPRGYRSSISPGGEFVVFQIMPQQAVERQARAAGKKRNEMPADSLGVFVFETSSLEKFAGLASYRLPEEPSDWMVYNINYSRICESDLEAHASEVDSEVEAEVVTEEQEAFNNRRLYVYNPVTKQKFQMDNIVEYVLSPFGTVVAGIAEVEDDGKDLQQIHTFDTRTLVHSLIESRKGMIRQIITDRDASQMAWLYSGDSGRDKVYELYLWDEYNSKSVIVDRDSDGMPRRSAPASNFTPYFSNDGQRLFFGTTSLPPPSEPSDTLLRDEKYSVDVWHWQDQIIQPQQQVMMRRQSTRNFLAVYHINEQRMVQLCNEDFPFVSLEAESNTLKGLTSTTTPYMRDATWAGSSIRDLYVKDLYTGARTLIKRRAESTANLSPAGNFVVWYDHEELAWMSYNINTNKTNNITSHIPEILYDEQNDVPLFADPYGIAGWAEEDEYVLIYDRHDIWKVDPANQKAPENLTRGYARENNLRMRLVNLDNRSRFVDSERLIFEAFHYRNKRNGYYAFESGQLKQLIMDDASFFQPHLSSNGKRMVWRRSTFTEYSDLWMGEGDFSKARRISEVNPQQADYLWGSVQLVEWEDFQGDTLQGLLYLPEDYDPDKKYPTIVYFYERSSNGLHQHFIPSPSRSTINRPYSTSNGYALFVPDITYKTGYPGESAYNAVVSGTKAMLEQFPFLDADNLGLQGQSWGGYQITYLITRTNMFRAAMAGAPVSNMVSAYGGIRWESGRSRQYQYEYTQSRIGGTLWEKKDNYVENSPVFFADRIETPLLMMHNDQDGAVPWYQGIEMFMAMRRLDKPVWMLVYNGEAHNLTRWPNRMDLSVRMYQFFDYYLKGEPAPRWLLEGIPAREKGLVHGYDLIED